MSSSVDQIKSRIDIVSLVSSYIKLDKAGASWKGKCPFHNEKTPSFFVSPDRGSYYCFGCNASGDIFTFVEEFEGLDFKGALKLLADRAGVVLETYRKEDKEVKSEKEKLYEVMEEATKFFENNLKDNPEGKPVASYGAGNEALEYLKLRGLTEKTIKDFRIGFAILDWRRLYDYLKSKNFSDNEIEKAGLAKKPEDKSKAMYDRFRGRVMFPISDSSGRIIAFSGRILVDDGKSAKYLNSPETPIFNKSSVLFGIDKAKDSIRKNNFSILVEGQMDLVLSHQAGFKNTVASSGTALKNPQEFDSGTVSNFTLIQRLSNNIILVFDYDKAGFDAAVRAAKIALELDMNVKAIEMPKDMDPADFISKNGYDKWKESIKKAKYIIEFLFEKYIPKSTKVDSLTIKLEISKNIIPVLNHIKNPITRSHFLSIISHHSGISVVDITTIANKELEKKLDNKVKEIENVDKQLRKDPIERRLLGIAFWQEGMQNRTIQPEMIFAKLEQVKELYKDIKEDLIYEAEAFYANSENLQKDVDEMLLSIEEEYLNEELVGKMIELKNLKDKKLEVEILKRISEINKRKEEIKNSRNKK